MRSVHNLGGHTRPPFLPEYTVSHIELYGVLKVFRLADVANKKVAVIDTNLLALFSQLLR